jgi:hypothetical protein
MVNILELSIIKAIAPFEICISGGGCALAALNLGHVRNALQKLRQITTHFLVRNAMGHETALEADASGLELI